MSIAPLSADERDGAGELMNVGAGHAVTALARLAGRYVDLAVPRVRLGRLDELAAADDAPGAWAYAAFDGPFGGGVGLTVPDSAHDRFLDHLRDAAWQQHVPTHTDETLWLSVGHVVCLTCLSGVGTAFDVALVPGPVVDFSGRASDALATMSSSERGDTVLVVCLELALAHVSAGRLCLAIGAASLGAFRAHLTQYLAALGL